jgi:hypothetical protein
MQYHLLYENNGSRNSYILDPYMFDKDGWDDPISDNDDSDEGTSQSSVSSDTVNEVRLVNDRAID